ncbi:peroxiredoxin [Algimonas ampicilliniresistens]|uniref:thioredoxin-dependent peroxiredoxin n=1 Tax=Algimonas ampicilliniresistens TaxID=1298735 RepID=A0ABQ5V9B6_9PROT|nr:thioredoxin-dependent thiol peroxidase [Algimonas ampicilliniresistens]GLQ23181.1 peroxiredoxin [Algimonas ampicilliniresistens]
MSQLQVGDMAPDFTLPGDNGEDIRLSNYRGQNVILYFYPRDDTPGCTKEAIGFTEAKTELEALNTVVIGMSKDTPAKHDKFIAKHELDLRLASDEAGDVLEDYGVWVEKKNYGKTYMGIVRSTFLIGSDGNILQVWPKVRVKGHVEAVVEAVRDHAG